MGNILEKPLIRTYQYNAFAESIMGCHRDYQEWLAGNYVQIMVCEDFENSINVIEYLAGSIFGGCPLLDNQGKRKSEIMESYESCVEYLDSALKQGYYIYTFVDEYYIPNRVSYGKNHFEHDILLYGREQEAFVYIGYDALGNYTKGMLSTEQFYQAMQTDNMCLIMVSLNSSEYKFDIEKFIFMLKQYVCAEDSRQNLDVYLDMSKYNAYFYDSKLHKPLSFGSSVYEPLERLIAYYDEAGAFYDWRVLHLLHEHKQAMYHKLKYLGDKKYLENSAHILMQYKEIVDRAALIENLGLKYQITRAGRVSKEIRRNILELQREEEILGRVLDSLIRQNGFEGI